MIDFKENRNAFDDEEPSLGHEVRFGQRLEKELHRKKKLSNSWLKVAASIILLASVGSLYHFAQKKDITAQVAVQIEEANSPNSQLGEAEYYYQRQFDEQFGAITAMYNDDESKLMIQQSQLLIADLQIEHKELQDEFTKTGDHRVATAMILNYKSRISILETLIEKLKYVSLQKNKQHEKINA